MTHAPQISVAPAQDLSNSISETTPLLPDAISKKASDGGVQGRSATTYELVLLLKYSIPICITHLLELSLVTVTVISVGHLGTLELAAASLASMTTNVVALSFIQGAASALDTVSSISALPRIALILTLTALPTSLH